MDDPSRQMAERLAAGAMTSHAVHGLDSLITQAYDLQAKQFLNSPLPGLRPPPGPPPTRIQRIRRLPHKARYRLDVLRHRLAQKIDPWGYDDD